MNIDFPRDFLDIIQCLDKNDCRYVIIGGYAMAASGYIRATGDIDILIEPSPENSSRVYKALIEFGAPVENVTVNDFSTEGTVFQMGLAPLRIDIVTKADGLTFEDAVSDARIEIVNSLRVPFLSIRKLIINKEKTGREKDKADSLELKKLLEQNNEP